MADLEKTVAIIFEGVDQMGAGITSATGKIDDFTSKVEQAAAPLANVTKAILAAEVAAAALAVAFGQKAISEATKFEAALADLQKTLGEGDGSAESYAAELNELSNAYGVSSDLLVQSMADYKQAGFTAEESLGLVKNGLDLVIAGDVEAAQSSEILVQALKGFKAPASEANQLLEVLNASSNTYATDVEQLAQGMGMLSPIASTLGLSFEETAELLIPVIEVFRSGPEAANALRTGLLQLGADTAPVTDTLERLGIAQRDSNGVLRSSTEILKDVAAATSDMEAAEKLFVAQQLFGIEQSSKMVEVLGSLERGNIDVAAAMQNSSTVAEEVAIKLATAERTAQRTATAFDNMAGTIGGKFLTEMTGINNAIGEIFRQMDGAVAAGELDPLFEELNGHLKQIERLALEVANALPEALENADYSGFSDGLEALFGDLENVEITAEDLQGVIEGLGSGFRSLSEFTSGTIEVFKGVAEVMGPVIQAFTELDSDTQQWLGVIGGAALVVGPTVAVIGSLTTAVGALAGTGGVLAQAITRSDSLMEKFGKGSGLALVAFELGEAFVNARERLREFNEQPITLAEKINSDLADIENIQGDEFSIFNVENIAAGYETIKQYFGWGSEAEADFNQLSEAAVAAAVKVVESAGSIGGESAEDVKRISDAAIEAALGVANASSDLESAFSGLNIPLIDQLANLPGPMEDAAYHIVSGSADITASVGEIEDAANRLHHAFLNGLIDEDQLYSGISALSELKGQLSETADSQEALTGEVLSSEEAILKARQAVLDQTLALEELASNERIKNMEFAVDFQIAKMETDAKKVEAILSATSETISSTADAAASMFGILGDLSFGDRFAARDAIEQQLEIQQQAADQQEKLIAAQIKSLNAKTQALQNGDGLIKISSDGLEPALEMIMWEVIEKVQMRANAEGAEFLLGL
ncbi:phage tail tape measure protein [Vreelandella lionensis]|uniref:Phage tail tape measure protein n=1 Tax=Vreelandella lionensis TaxID=1144478 RepID=A0ABW8BNS8_9GAMM